MKKWIAVAAVTVALTGLVGAAAVAQQGAGPTEAARAASAQQQERQAEAEAQAILPADLKWQSNPDLDGVQSAAGVGDPTKGDLYVLFGKMGQDARFPAHEHPDARITTVLSGTMYYGIGERFGEAEVEAYPAGSVVYTPPGVPHFMWAKDGETVVQETGHGPTDIEFVPEA